MGTKFWGNFKALFSVQFITLLVPFILYPFLIRVLGVDTYGNVVFVQAINAYFLIGVQFGFSLYATKEVSINRNNKDELDIIFTSVFSIKFILSLLLFVPYVYLYSFLNIDFSKLIYVLFYLSCFSDVLLSQWYFHGLEKLKYLSIITCIGKVLTIPLTLYFIHDSSDLIFYIVIIKGIELIISLGAFFYIKKHMNVRFSFNMSDVKSKFYGSSSFFFSRLSVVISDKIVVTLLGANDRNADVVVFDLAQKLIALMQVPFTIINQAYYPGAIQRNNPQDVIKFVNKVAFISIFIFFISLVLIEPVVEFYAGKDVLYAATIFKILALIVVFNVFNHNYGNCIMMANGLDKEFNISIFIPILFFVLFIVVLNYIEALSLLIVAYSMVAYSIFILSIRIFYIKKMVFHKC